MSNQIQNPKFQKFKKILKFINLNFKFICPDFFQIYDLVKNRGSRKYYFKINMRENLRFGIRDFRCPLRLASSEASRRFGFSLIEVVVTLGIFSLLSVVIIDVYLLALKSQQQTSLRQQTLANLRYAAETISRQIRNSEIDYNYSYNQDGDSGLNGAETELALIDQAGNNYIYSLNGGELYATVNGQPSPLTEINQVKVLKALFFIEPIKDPFKEERCNAGLNPTGCLNGPPPISCTLNDSALQVRTGFCQCAQNTDCATGFCDLAQGICLPVNEQPRVTMILGFQSAGQRPQDIKTVYLQTTASSRVYKR
ncbi:MAG: hypothetical protein A2729_03065 [Candidatus Buchananbacteria bacterium RIFCSPHIGHO2_01_FULL_39_14]|uniref:Prepilin-type N-terminal cleavage/methylation domain-containing protein n=2 Tax=Candidatus Buchananiibacteriota TaxID=1817903 RepID=A0A1G1YUD6_9BACT|nr:MAG: hypothetical protein A2729_03065 [Candidatus Buchananbacteria bacterium RIFCSPHIGHO2_01_FULL_39_14]OGY49011.1 MAG: hypothetical protein A3D39_01410 [Candidatus Buchananbacteria bacterium RIFCSPHIGHO2_02_FULL_39_17]OGY55973.1 MAG: hypothetical protein A2912_03255 [Candidatus Buchananbacteria bacterium RIFCSPLOWO2_01_FULL_40_23b]